MKRGDGVEAKGGIVDPVLQEKVMVSGRVPRYVVQYAKTRDLSISELIMAGFDRYRENDVDHAFERLSYHEDRVLHWKRIVLQNESECNTKQALCITIRKQFRDAGRPSGDMKLDRGWLEARVLRLQSQGIPVTLDELYEYCVKEEEKR